MSFRVLGNLVRIKTGKLDANASSKDGEYPFFTCARTPLKIDSYSYDCKCVLVAGNGDLNVKFYEGKFDAYQRTYIVESLNEEILNTRYLFWFLEKYIEKLRELSIGGVIKYIKLSNLTDPEIPLPPLDTQKRIVAILDQADALRQKRKQAIALLDEYVKSVFLEMFGDPVSNPKGWETTSLQSISKMSSGSTPSRDISEYYGGRIPWVKTTEVNYKFIANTEEFITDSGLKNSSCKLYPKDSILIAMYGQGKTRGKVGILGIEATTNQACCVIEPSENYCSLWLFSLLKMLYENLRSMGKGGNQPNLNVGILKSYKIIFPPLKLQNKFKEKLMSIELIKQKMFQQFQELDTQFNALMQRAFNGELTE